VSLPEKEKQIIRRLQSEINEEISFLDELCKELEVLRPRLRKGKVSVLDLRAAGSILHDFYNGVENIFRRIAQELNGGLPAISWISPCLPQHLRVLPGRGKDQSIG